MVGHPCPNDSRLHEFATGRLPQEDMDAIDRHLDACPACRAIVGAAGLRTGAVDPGAALCDGVVARPCAGDVIHRHRLSGLLGTGAMGVVYRATDLALGRSVAIKLLHHSCVDPRLEHRLAREASTLAQLSHPNVVRVFDVGRANGRTFIAMELVEGPTLRQWLRERPRSVAAIVDAFIAAAMGLSAAHAVGVIHRDFKPENVLVGQDGRVRVTDFGLALESAAAQIVTQPGRGSGGSGQSIGAERSSGTFATVGTPAYMAPEQHLGHDVSPACDQFALCVALYEALWGERPFPGRTYEELRAAVLRGAIAPGRKPNRDVPRGLEQAILRGLSRDPSQRHASMAELIAALRRRPRSWRALAAAAGLVAVAGSSLAMAARTSIGCEGVGAELESVWSEHSRGRVQHAFAATGTSYAEAATTHTLATLDEHAARWRTVRRDVCESRRSGVTTEAGHLAATACLAQRSRMLAATVALLARADAAVVERASSLVGELDAPEACRDAETGPRPEADDDPEQARLQALLDEATVLRRAGHVAEAHALHERHRAAFDALPASPLRARALLSLGMIEQERRSPDAAIAALRAAHQLAQEHSMARETSVAALRLAGVYCDLVGDREIAQVWLRNGQLASRSADDPELTSAALRTAAMLHRAEGQHPQARAEYQDGLRILVREGKTDPLITAGVWLMLSGVSRHLREYTRAELEARQSLVIARTELGASHPFVARVYGGLADTALARGDLREGRAFIDAGVAIERLQSPRRSLTLPTLLYQRGQIESEAGEYTKAIATLEEAASLYEAAGAEQKAAAPLTVIGLAQLELGLLDAAHANVSRALELEYRRGQVGRTDEALALHNLATVESVMGRTDDARARFTKAIELWEATLGPEARTLSLALGGLGQLELAAGNPVVARALLERALPLFGTLHTERDDLADTEFAYARALWADPSAGATERRRAIELAGEAAARYADVGPLRFRRRDEAARWAAEHAARLESAAR